MKNRRKRKEDRKKKERKDVKHNRKFLTRETTVGDLIRIQLESPKTWTPHPVVFFEHYYHILTHQLSYFILTTSAGLEDKEEEEEELERRSEEEFVGKKATSSWRGYIDHREKVL